MEKIISLLDQVLERIRKKEDQHTYTRIIELLVSNPNNSVIVFVRNLEDNHVFSNVLEIFFEILIILLVIIILCYFGNIKQIHLFGLL